MSLRFFLESGSYFPVLKEKACVFLKGDCKAFTASGFIQIDF